MRCWWVALVLVACGDNRKLALDATSTDRPDAVSCVGLVCDDGDACTMDVCSDVDGCEHVSLDRCAQPECALGVCAGADTDGDGLQDAWELQGYVDVNCNGRNDGDGVDVQLPDADVNVPDVYIEIDYLEMAGTGAACTNDLAGDIACNTAVLGESCVAGQCTHSHKPRQATLDLARLTAARGLPPLPGDPPPPADLAGKPGFRIHWDLAHSNAIPETTTGGLEVISFGTTPGVRALDPACVGSNAQNYFDLKEQNFYNTLAGGAEFYQARRLVYHYAIAGHYSECPPGPLGGNELCDACTLDRGGGHPGAGSSGSAEIPGNDFMLSLGDRFFALGRPVSFLPREEAGTLLHELGHNLGLMHSVDVVNGVAIPALVPEFNPIYFSVMNYNYQFGLLFADTAGSATPTSIRLDYADDTTCAPLVESAIVESDGAQCGATTKRVIRYTPNTGVPVFGSATTGVAVDWDGSGGISTSSAAIDLNAENGTVETFYSFDDWEYAAGRFTHLAFDSFCSPWTTEDGVASRAVTFER